MIETAKRDRRRKNFSVIDPAEHINLARSAAWWACRRWGGDKDEWLGPAYDALIAAARTFDPTKGLRFSTLAVRSMQKKLWNFQQSRIGEKNYTIKMDGASVVVPLRLRTQAVFDRDGGHIPIRDDSPGPSPVREDDEEARKVLAAIPTQWREVLLRRLRGIQLHLIGEEMGLSKERVRQIQNKAIARARAVALRRAG